MTTSTIVKISVGSLILVLALGYVGYRGYQRYYKPDPDKVLKEHVAAAEKQIEIYQEEIRQADQDLQAAKKASAAFYEQSVVNARNAAAWRTKYIAVATERDQLKRALTGQEAIIEMRKLGYVK
jgi:uncharacterized membrane protein YebE (DUF533 family)